MWFWQLYRVGLDRIWSRIMQNHDLIIFDCDGVLIDSEVISAQMLIAELAGSSVVSRELERVVSLPFASPSGFVVVQANSPQARDMLIVAQDQHRQVLDAIERREGARAEAIMREHSRIAQRNLRDAVQSHNLDRMPGVRLIRQRG